MLKKNVYIYENNFFYKNWINKETEDDKIDEIIEYILPLESIEVIEEIKKMKII